eukprot:5576581-Pyramimonas_sp.AAC.1
MELAVMLHCIRCLCESSSPSVLACSVRNCDVLPYDAPSVMTKSCYAMLCCVMRDGVVCVALACQAVLCHATFRFGACCLYMWHAALSQSMNCRSLTWPASSD